LIRLNHARLTDRNINSGDHCSLPLFFEVTGEIHGGDRLYSVIIVD